MWEKGRGITICFVMSGQTGECTSDASATQRAFCRGCGYALFGLASRNCPECGKGFDPADARTYSRRPPRGAVWRWGRRLVVVLLAIGLPLGMGLGWLGYRWRSEQKTLAQLRDLGGDFDIERMGPPGLSKVMGNRLGYLLDRADWVAVSSLPEAEMDKLEFQSLGHLKSLTLYSCGITEKNLGGIGPVRTLRALNICGGPPGGSDLAFLEDLGELRLLDLSIWSIRGKGMKRIAGLRNLRSLALSSCWLQDGDLKALEGLSDLEKLDLQGNPITDAGLEHLKNLKSLRTLTLGGTRVTAEGRTALKKQLPRLLW